MEEKQRNIEVKGAWLKVFCPNARCLSEEEIIALPPEKKQAAEETGEKGLWLEVFCPDDACLADEEKINIPEINSKHFSISLKKIPPNR